MIGTADLRASSTSADPDPADSIQAVHRILADHGCWRMDIVGTREAAAAAFADGAQLVVYNLTHSLMQHFALLVAVGPAH